MFQSPDGPRGEKGKISKYSILFPLILASFNFLHNTWQVISPLKVLADCLHTRNNEFLLVDFRSIH